MATFFARRAAFVALWRAFRDSGKPGTPGIGERLRAIPRMLGARIRGRYTDLAWGRLGLIAAAVGYIVSPIDLVPELVLAVPGLLDDTVVAAWLAGTVLAETERFIAWEQGVRVRGEQAPQHSEVIDGEVVS